MGRSSGRTTPNDRMTDTTVADSAAADAPRAAAPATGVDWLALGAALLTVVLWASAFVGIRAVADDLSPGAFTLGRLLVAAVVLGIFVAIRRPGLPTQRRDWLLIAVSGVVWFGGYFTALNAGEALVDAGTAAMLVNVGPILIALFAGLFLGEGFPQRLVVGSAIAFMGTLVIGVATGGQADAPNAPLGVALCLIAAVAYATGVTVQKPALANVRASFRVTATAPVLTDFLDDTNHPMSATGTVQVPGITGPEGARVTAGVVNLLVAGDGRASRRMLYTLPFFGVDGRPYVLDGVKDVRDHGRFDVWASTTTLHTRVRQGNTPDGAVVLSGELRLTALDFARQLTTVRITATANPLRQAEALVRFGLFFAGSVWDVFVRPKLPRLTRTSPGVSDD